MDVFGIGITVVDQQFMVKQLPAEDQKERAVSMRTQVGGPVPTALVLLQRFGFTTHLVSPWGADPPAQYIQQDLHRENVSCSSSCVGDRTTGLAHVWVSETNGSRTIVSHAADWDGLTLSGADSNHLQTCRLLHTDGAGAQLTVESARTVKRNGGLVTVDAGSPKKATADLIPLADVFSFPERFARQFFETTEPDIAGKRLLELGARAAVCTLGQKGARVYSCDGITFIPAFPVQTVDSTGAGDIFCGGLISGILDGDSCVEAAYRGAAAAALKCRHSGNREAIPDRDTVLALIRD